MNLRNLICAGLFALSGCVNYEYIEKDEEAIVSEKTYTPSGLVYIGSEIVLSIERYTTKFDGEIDFEVHDSKIYKKFNVGDLAYLRYYEVYPKKLADMDNDGKKEDAREMEKPIFIDAVQITDIEAERFFKKFLEDYRKEIVKLN